MIAMHLDAKVAQAECDLVQILNSKAAQHREQQTALAEFRLETLEPVLKDDLRRHSMFE